jgi:di/tricarboxylate transporter
MEQSSQPSGFNAQRQAPSSTTVQALPDPRRRELLLGLSVVTLFAAFFAISIQDSEAAAVYRGAGVLVLLVGLIATKAVPDHVAALAFFVVSVGAVGIAPEVAFSGFYAGASWLIFAGSIIAVALTDSGLSARLAHRLLGFVGRSYASVIATIAVGCIVLAFLLPSTAARIMLLIPIVLALAESLGYGPRSKGRTGMVIAALTLSFLPCASILTSGNRTLAMVGLAQTLYDIEFRYSDFLLLNFPVLTTALVILMAGLLVWRYHEPPRETGSGLGIATPSHHSQKAVLAIVLCALVLWTTDFLHHVSPAWIGLAAVVALLVGPSRDLPLMAKAKLEYWLMFVAFISLGGVITATGLGAQIGETLVSIAGLAPADSTISMIQNLGAISLISIGINLAATNLAGPVVLLTLAESIAAASGLSVQATLIVMMPSFAICPLAFQAPIFLIAMRMAGLPLKELNICLLIISGLTLGVLIPLQFLWLWTIGVLP